MSIEPAKETVLFGFDDRQVQVSQEAYSIFMAREHELRQQLADVSNERDGLRAKLECSQGDMRQADQVMERQRTQISDLEQSLEDSPHALASALCQKLATMRGGPIDWAEAIAITAIVTRLSPEEEARLLAFDAVAPATDGEGVSRVITLSGCKFTEHELIERAVRAATGTARRGTQRWISMKDAFGCGSGVANALCHRFDFDPDEMVKP